MKKIVTDRGWRVRLWTYAPLILWIAVIFYLSTDRGSAGVTIRFVGVVFHFFFPDGSEESLQFVHFCVRKGAHLTVYAMLAILAARVHLKSPGLAVRKYWPLGAIGIVLLIATLDEFNQSFSPLRTGVPTDVLIDTLGGSIALIILQAVRWLRKIR